MSDNLDSDHHDQDIHGEGMTDDAVHEAPSSYEFADENAAADEHTEEHSPLPSEGDQTPKKRSPLLPIAAAVGGVLVLGAVAWWQFGGGVSEPIEANYTAPAPTSMASVPATKIPDAVAPIPHMATPPVDTSVPVAAKVDAAPVSVASAPVAPVTASVAPALPSAPMPDVKPSASAQPVLTNNAPVSTTSPSAASAPVIASAMTAPAALPASVPVSSASVAPAVVSDAKKVEELNARIDTLQKSLDAANALAASAKEAQDKLAQVEKQLEDMRHAAPSLEAPVSVPTDMAQIAPVPHAAHKAAHVVKTKSVTTHHKTTHHKAHMATKSTPKPAINHWVLRAATPDQAWIATGPATADLKQLEVGDTFAAIGKVTAIRQEGDSWVVQGTKGSIR